MQVLIDFLNCEPTLKELKRFLVKAGQAIREKSPPDSFMLPDICVHFKPLAYGEVFFLKSARDLIKQGHHVDERRREANLDIYPPDDPKKWINSVYFQHRLGTAMGLLKGRYYEFIESCVAGAPDLEFLNQLQAEFTLQTFVFEQGEDSFRPTLQVVAPLSENVAEYLAFDVLTDFLCGRGVEYKRIKRCLFCNRFTAGGSMKRAYCSMACANAFNYRRRKDAATKPKSK